MSIFGTRVLRREDPRILTVGGTYVDDLDDHRLAGAVYVTFVRSTVAHARIRSIDVSDAATAPGVLGVFTAPDVKLRPTPPIVAAAHPAITRPVLPVSTVRFVGEPVAIVVTEAKHQGEDAAELVVVDYEPLPAVVDLEDAASDRVVLHEAAGTNRAFELGAPFDDHLFDGCEVVVRQRLRNNRVAHAPLEVRGAAAAWDGERLTLWMSTQSPQLARDGIQSALRLEPGQLHLITPDVGGGFGGKVAATPEEVLVGWVARHLARPARWNETRTENMTAMAHGRGQVQHVTIGGSRDGRVDAYRLEIICDVGAYCRFGVWMGAMTHLMAQSVYAIPRVEAHNTSVMTNTTPTMAFRGGGRPEAIAAMERAMDLFAVEIGMDPVDVRRKNLIPADAFPFETHTGATYDTGDYERALDLVLDRSGYEQLRKEQAERRALGDPIQLGIGVAVYVEITGGSAPGTEVAKVEITPAGGARVYTGSSPHGQGHVTSWSMIASDRLGIPMDSIEVIHGDTDLVPVGKGTMGSWSLQLAGSAVHQASVELVELARQRAADQLEANPDDVVLDTTSGRFHVMGTPTASRSWAELATADEPLVADTAFRAASPTFPFGAHVAVVEVDTETGKVVVRRFVAVDDAGTILNPMIFDGQIHGGVAQGIAQALCEEVVYDDDGNPLTTNFADYGIISGPELPSFELVSMETPTTANPLGAKGVGESGAVGATPAVQSAVVDALSHLGVRHVDIPLTAERVWTAVREACDGQGGS